MAARRDRAQPNKRSPRWINMEISTADPSVTLPTTEGRPAERMGVTMVRLVRLLVVSRTNTATCRSVRCRLHKPCHPTTTSSPLIKYPNVPCARVASCKQVPLPSQLGHFVQTFALMGSFRSGVFVRVRGQPMCVGCYKCAKCNIPLKTIGKLSSLQRVCGQQTGIHGFLFLQDILWWTISCTGKLRSFFLWIILVFVVQPEVP